MLVLFLVWIIFLIFFFFTDSNFVRIFSLILFTLYVIYRTYERFEKSKYSNKTGKSFNQLMQMKYFIQTLKGTTKLKDVLRTFLKNLISESDFDRAMIYIIKYNNKTTIGFAAGYNKQGEFTVDYTCPFDKQRSILARSIIENKVCVIADVSHNRYCEQLLVESLGLEEFGLIPIVVEGIDIGIISVDNYVTKKKIEKSTLEALAVPTNQIGIAIENTRAYEKIQNLEIKDGLTDIYNHRYFQEVLRKEFQRTGRYKRPLSLILIDIDDFKYYNTTNGYANGDKLLKDITNLFRENVRGIDILARYGGEEFVIILPETIKEHAFSVAEKIRKLVEKHHFKYAKYQPSGKVTISTGISNYPADADSPESLIDTANKVLYLAKSTGKNKVCIKS